MALRVTHPIPNTVIHNIEKMSGNSPSFEKEKLIWNTRVKEEIKKIKSQNLARKKTEIVQAWQKNRNLLVEENIATAKKTWKEVPQNNRKLSDEKCKVFDGETGTIQEISMKVMPLVIPSPTMTTWTPILRNIRFSHSEKQSDQVMEKEDLSDEMFLDLVTALQHAQDPNPQLPLKRATGVTALQHFAKDPVPQQHSKRATDPDPKKKVTQKKTNVVEGFIEKTSLPNICVFQAIAFHFPESCTSEKVMTRYQNLTAPKEKLKIHPLNHRLCRRCFIHDCDLHKEDPQVDEPLPWMEKPATPPFPKTPCGNQCFLEIPGISTTLMGNSQLPTGFDPTQEDWTATDKTMFRAFIKTFPTDFCAVAKALRTKECRQVYNFSCQENASSMRKKSITPGSPSKSVKTSNYVKKMKNQQQIFKTHCAGVGDVEYNQPFSPCHHPGKPCDEDCSCRLEKNLCEKFCYCSPDCKNRFPGCSCKGNCTTKHCNCFRASRECDPDLCETCSASQFNFDLETCSCRNVFLQKKMGKKIFVAPSDIAGWGCFIDEDVCKGEFIEEYVGEMIDVEEADRRGKIYDKSNCSYLFTINDQFVLDATRFGGKIRFANHSNKPNCKARVVMVNGDHRIGIYAGQNIEKGEEICFDYGNDFRGKGIKWN